MRITKYNAKNNRETKLPELVKEKAVNYKSFSKMTEPHLIVDMMNELFDLQHETEEHMYMLIFNSKMDLKGVFEISHGTVNLTVANPREVFMKALLGGAVNIVLLHNHPSGDARPSNEDIKVTQRIKTVGEMLDVSLVDHIVVGDGNFISMKEKCFM